MDKNKIMQANLLDIVFDDRNKMYGAYELRSKYSSRLSKALLTTGGLALVVLLASFVGSRFETKSSTSGFIIDSTILIDPPPVNEPIVEPPPPPPPVKQVEPRIETSHFTSLRVVDEDIKPEEAMKDVRDMEDTKISTTNVDGIKGGDIVSPPIEDINTGIIITPKKDPQQEIFRKVEIEASFPGGDEAWRKYISKEIQRNIDELEEAGKAGTCTVQFIVDLNGTISDIEVLSMSGTKLAEICANAIRKGPKWIPAVQNGNTVKAYRKQPVTFRIDNQ